MQRDLALADSAAERLTPADRGRAGPIRSSTMTGFARALAAAGVAADPDRWRAALDALPHARRPRRRAGLLGRPADPVRRARRPARYDAAFDAGLRRPAPPLPGPQRHRRRRGSSQLAALAAGAPATAPRTTRTPSCGTAASADEVLRHRDVAELTAAEREELRRLIALLAPRPGRAARAGAARHAAAASTPRRTVRATLRHGGEPAVLRTGAGRAASRGGVVLLLDVCGSMAPYADALLRFAHAAVRGGARGRRDLHPRHPADPRHPRAAPARPRTGAARRPAAIPDWSGGTRLGEVLRRSSTAGASAGTARRAVVVVSPTAGSAGTPNCSASRWRGWPGWPTRWSG